MWSEREDVVAPHVDVDFASCDVFRCFGYGGFGDVDGGDFREGEVARERRLCILIRYVRSANCRSDWYRGRRQ